jgi:phosphoglycolate phosphatase
MQTFDNILFDLDGTLTDPKAGIIHSILYALEKLNIMEPFINELDAFIGPPLRDSFQMRYHLSDELADQALSFYRAYFSQKGIFENEPYPGVAELLKSLVAQNHRLYVATSKPTVFAHQILEHFHLDHYFSAVVGSNLDNTRTDKTEVISFLLAEQGLDAARSVMIGDRKHDLIGAKKNAMTSIAVTYGYGSLEELKAHQPDFMAHNCQELKDILEKNQAEA